MKIENKIVLVTGGAGFIGSNIIDALMQQNNQVICLDNYATGFEHNISHHFSHPNFTFINGSTRY